jgi:hypothetical protein
MQAMQGRPMVCIAASFCALGFIALFRASYLAHHHWTFESSTSTQNPEIDNSPSASPSRSPHSAIRAARSQAVAPSHNPLISPSPPAVDTTSHSCNDPRLTALLPSKDVVLDALDSYSSETVPWPPTFQCQPLEIYGGKPHDGGVDGDKAVCGLRQMQAPCIVVSLGSELDFTFEQAVSDASPCDIVTVDCTVDEAKAQAMLPPRTRFFSLCLGADGEDPKYVSLPRLMELAGLTHIDLLKIDVEGFGALSATENSPCYRKQRFCRVPCRFVYLVRMCRVSYSKESARPSATVKATVSNQS